MKRYAELVESTDRWFVTVAADYPGEMQCRRGCTLCCHGIFDISLPDAVELARALEGLPEQTRAAVNERARVIQEAMRLAAPDLGAPYLLSDLSEERIDEIAESAGNARCPLLGDRDECLVYDRRPLACRIEGAPMVDRRDGLFGDWCELNFTRGIPARALERLERDYYEAADIEANATSELSEILFGDRRERVTTFIPSLIAEFEKFWKPLLTKLGPGVRSNPRSAAPVLDSGES